MILKKEYMNIYLVTAIIVAAFVFMLVSTWKIVGDVSTQSSMDMAIDRQVDACWEKNELKE